MTLGEAIRGYIEENGFKRTFIAKKAGISDAVFNAIINDRRNMGAMEYYHICKALNVPLEKFIEEAEG